MAKVGRNLIKKNKFQIGKDLEVEKFIYGITEEIWENKKIVKLEN